MADPWLKQFHLSFEHFFFFNLWEPIYLFIYSIFFLVEVLLYGEFGFTENNFAIHSYRQLRRSSRMKKVCRKVENKKHKEFICFLGPILEKIPIKLTCTRNGRLSPIKFCRKSNPTQKKKVFPVFVSYNYFYLSSRTCVFLMTTVYSVLV